MLTRLSETCMNEKLILPEIEGVARARFACLSKNSDYLTHFCSDVYKLA